MAGTMTSVKKGKGGLYNKVVYAVISARKKRKKRKKKWPKSRLRRAQVGEGWTLGAVILTG